MASISAESSRSSSSQSSDTKQGKEQFKFTNKLIHEKSPYLLQHAHNPVDWLPWGEEAFKRAKTENKPILLSVGYSTCHWCHVMEHESFENEDIAKIMNENFINIKVDREERPDVDKIYMTFVQATSGGGGWPMNVFLTPDLKPFLGGTYFPPTDKYGRPGWPTLLRKVAMLWRTKRDQLMASGTDIVEQLQEHVSTPGETSGEITKIEETAVKKCFGQIASQYDSELGGFGDAPKFPRPVVFNFLFRIYDRSVQRANGPKITDLEKKQGAQALRMCEHTLEMMARGGMHDHLAGGFHRYSTTSDWHIPHYEKMLYDQGQLANAYIDAYQITKNDRYRKVAEGILNYVSSATMCHPEGGFYSAEDADSWPPETRRTKHKDHKKLEGAFYVWEKQEHDKLLGDKAPVFTHFFDVKEKGNAAPEADPHDELKNQNTLIQRHDIEETCKKFKMDKEAVEKLIDECKHILFQEREKRPRPHLDDKVITAWNGLIISAFARAAQVFNDKKYLDIGAKACAFIEKYLYKADSGRLIRNFREGPSNIEAFCEDYAFFISALLDMYEASFDPKYMRWAVKLQQTQIELFLDKENGGFYDVAAGSKELLFRTKEAYDGAEPSPNSVSALNLLRLSQMLGRDEWKELATKLLVAFEATLLRQPLAVPQLCVAVDWLQRPPREISILGEPEEKGTQELVRAVHDKYTPNKMLILLDEGKERGRDYFAAANEFYGTLQRKDNKPTIYVCENFTCKLPTNDSKDVLAQL